MGRAGISAVLALCRGKIYLLAPPSTPNKSLFGLVCGHADMEWVILPPCTALCENCFVRQKGLSSLPPSLRPLELSVGRPRKVIQGGGKEAFSEATGA